MGIHFGDLDSLKVVNLSIRRFWFPRSDQQNPIPIGFKSWKLVRFWCYDLLLFIENREPNFAYHLHFLDTFHSCSYLAKHKDFSLSVSPYIPTIVPSCLALIPNVKNPWVELTLENRLARGGCPRAYKCMVKLTLNPCGTLRS